MVSIANVQRPLQIRCSKYTSSWPCQHKYHRTMLWMLMDIDQHLVMYIPLLKCIVHNQYNKIFGWKSVKDRATLGPGDFLINNSKFWTLNRWNTKSELKMWHLSKKLHFTDSLMADFLRNMIVNS